MVINFRIPVNSGDPFLFEGSMTEAQARALTEISFERLEPGGELLICLRDALDLELRNPANDTKEN